MQAINRRANIAAMAFVMALCQVAALHAAAATLTIQKSFVKLIDTGLEDGDPHLSPRKAGKWLDDHRLLARVSAQDELSGPRVRYRGRTVLYDLSSRKTVDIMKYASPICWDPVSGKGALAVNDDPYDKSNKKQTVVGIRIDSGGKLTEQVSGLLRGNLGADCDVQRPNSSNERVLYPLRPEHGILDAGMRGKRDNEQAMFIRSDGQRIELPRKGDRVNEVRYLAFSDRYQISSWDDCSSAGTPCPPEIHLMDGKGGISLVTIPSEINHTISRYGTYYVVKDGILVETRSDSAPEGYFLLRDGVLHWLWKPGSSGFLDPERTEHWGRPALSPDGCKVAFTRGHRPSRIYVFDHCAVGK